MGRPRWTDGQTDGAYFFRSGPFPRATGWFIVGSAGWRKPCGKPVGQPARHIGSGEAASYRRLPPSGPQGPFMARTPARPDKAVSGTARNDSGRFRFGGAVQARLALRG